MNEFLDCGRIVNTHGVHGEVRVVPWADSPDFLCQFSTLYVDGSPLAVASSRVHKGSVIARFQGVDTVEALSSWRTSSGWTWWTRTAKSWAR